MTWRFVASIIKVFDFPVLQFSNFSIFRFFDFRHKPPFLGQNGDRVSARHDASLGYRVRGALLSMTAIARVKKACFPARRAGRDTEREIAQYGEFPEIGAMVDGAKRGIVAGAEAERLHSTATAASVTAIARACTLFKSGPCFLKRRPPK